MRSMKRIPCRWSNSCCTARASRPSASNSISSPERVCALTRTENGRGTSPRNPGKLRQPSFPIRVRPKVSIRGLMRTIGMRGSKSTAMPSSRIALGRSFMCGTSKTNNWSGRPTCWAARPMPSAARIVSIISSASWRIFASTFSTRRPLVRSAGWSCSVISRIIGVRVG